MNPRRVGLRLRVLGTLLGSMLLCGAPLAVVLLLRVRDEVARVPVAVAREELRTVAKSASDRCGASTACFREAADAAGLSWEEGAHRCGSSVLRSGSHVSVCQDVAGGTLWKEIDLSPSIPKDREMIGSLLGAILFFLALLTALIFWLLDRQLIAPLSRIDAALDHVSGTSGTDLPLAEGGDLLGRLAPAVNRLDQRLREERARVQAQIDELKLSNAELRRAREEVARNERLASLGRLAAGVAHEVGNPMTALIGFVSILEDRLKDGRHPGDYVQRIAREAGRIDRILRDLLNLGRPPPEHLSPVDLRGAAERAAGLVAAQPTWTGCELELRFPQALPSARGDDHYVVQVLVNLFLNAAKAGASKVEVDGRVEDEDPVIDVLDDGRGLPPEAATRLFEPFFSTSGPGGGTGLGLALCHATMERFGGSIGAKGREGRNGTVFTLRFRRWG